jgi:hypothetical protein
LRRDTAFGAMRRLAFLFLLKPNLKNFRSAGRPFALLA